MIMIMVGERKIIINMMFIGDVSDGSRAGGNFILPTVVLRFVNHGSSYVKDRQWDNNNDNNNGL